MVRWRERKREDGKVRSMGRNEGGKGIIRKGRMKRGKDEGWKSGGNETRK